MTATLRDRDGKHVDGFALRSWLGFAEDHFVELDFAAQLKSLPAGRKVYLVLAGWTDYPYPESIYAATQAGVPPVVAGAGAEAVATASGRRSASSASPPG